MDIDDFDDNEGLFGLIGSLFRFIGGLFRWLFFLGKKPLKQLMEQEIINGFIGFGVVALLIWLLFTQVLKLILHFL